MATPLEWTNILSCSGLNICSLLTKTWECPVSPPQDLWLVCLWVCLMMFKGVKYFKVSLVLNLFLLSQKLFNSCQAWAFVYCLSHLQLVGIFLSATVFYQYPSTFGVYLLWWEKKKKKTVLKKPPKSGLWLCKIILIFPGDEPLECIYLVEFPLFIDIYTHIYIHTLHFLYVFNIIVCFFSFGA